MALIKCEVCKGDGKSRLVKLDNGDSLPCEYCSGKGKVGAVTIEEVKTRRFDILERIK